MHNHKVYLWSKFQLNLTLFTGVNVPQMGTTVSWTKKTLFLLGKVESGKNPEAEIWHPESIDGWSYYRLWENFWWPFGALPWSQFRPNLSPTMFFCLILQGFCDFSGVWDLRYLILLRILLLQKFWFLAIFLVVQW